MSMEPSASWVLGKHSTNYAIASALKPLPRQADWVSICVGLRLSHSRPRLSRRLLAPWMLSAPPLAVPSPPSWDPMPSRYHCPSARRSATASTPPTHGATTGGYWHRSSPWTGESPKLQSPPLPLILKVWHRLAPSSASLVLSSVT